MYFLVLLNRVLPCFACLIDCDGGDLLTELAFRFLRSCERFAGDLLLECLECFDWVLDDEDSSCRWRWRDFERLLECLAGFLVVSDDSTLLERTTTSVPRFSASKIRCNGASLFSSLDESLPLLEEDDWGRFDAFFVVACYIPRHNLIKHQCRFLSTHSLLKCKFY